MATVKANPEKPKKIKGVDQWEAENAADTMIRSFQIKRDKKLLPAALEVIRQRKEAANKALGWAGGL